MCETGVYFSKIKLKTIPWKKNGRTHFKIHDFFTTGRKILIVRGRGCKVKELRTVKHLKNIAVGSIKFPLKVIQFFLFPTGQKF